MKKIIKKVKPNPEKVAKKVFEEVEEDIEIRTLPPETVDITTTETSGTTTNPESTSTYIPEEKPRAVFYYPVPETKEDLLALHKCLKDLGVNSIGDLEVRASRL